MWTLFDNIKNTTKGYTTKGEEFNICSSPKTSLFGYIHFIIFFSNSLIKY